MVRWIFPGCVYATVLVVAVPPVGAEDNATQTIWQFRPGATGLEKRRVESLLETGMCVHWVGRESPLTIEFLRQQRLEVSGALTPFKPLAHRRLMRWGIEGGYVIVPSNYVQGMEVFGTSVAGPDLFSGEPGIVPEMREIWRLPLVKALVLPNRFAELSDDARKKLRSLVERLGELTDLEVLVLPSVYCREIDERNVAFLSNLKELRILELHGSVSPASLTLLGSLPRLEYLALQTEFAEDDRQKFDRGFSALRYLRMSIASDLSPDGTRHVQGLPSLEHVEVSSWGPNRQTLRIADLPNLSSLVLDGVDEVEFNRVDPALVEYLDVTLPTGDPVEFALQFRQLKTLRTRVPGNVNVAGLDKLGSLKHLDLTFSPSGGSSVRRTISDLAGLAVARQLRRVRLAIPPLAVDAPASERVLDLRFLKAFKNVQDVLIIFGWAPAGLEIADGWPDHVRELPELQRLVIYCNGRRLHTWSPRDAPQCNQ